MRTMSRINLDNGQEYIFTEGKSVAHVLILDDGPGKSTVKIDYDDESPDPRLKAFIDEFMETLRADNLIDED